MQIVYVERDEFNALLGLKDTHNFITLFTRKLHRVPFNISIIMYVITYSPLCSEITMTWFFFLPCVGESEHNW